jgi:hypothetical protein
VVGCAIGHHEARKHDREQRQDQYRSTRYGNR